MAKIPDLDADPRPVFEQIADDLRGRIKSGRLPVGRKLPPQTALAEDYGVAINTVRAALKVLAREGLVRTRSTRGTFVLREPEEPAPTSAELFGMLQRIIDRLDQVEVRLNELEQRKP
ncbi:hypothetical protein Acsp03_71520 [Actinomadura sp. NBRC 104412]|uniref:GntR family transcriptional regulator n=1 Tax=Actinomadura sp. NBRC 104412 TaxID=3032203 RepID=UPI0024A3ED08|nr:winged helix-turn-helix domain-containing protein [Actinomadura sp. NBRC 104412]GLZ09686.1 hypothetical protein Acsp03_71520 [Actinomadura sp. NBRC 104412]